LNVIHIQLPPLREMQEDIPLLASRFLARYCSEMNIEPKTLDSGAIRSMMLYPWPGNVRELENEIKRLAVSVLGNVITEQDLSKAIQTGGGLNEKGKPSDIQSLKDTVEQVEKRLIQSALDSSGHNQVKTAQMLGLSRQGLIKKMKRYGIK